MLRRREPPQSGYYDGLDKSADLAYQTEPKSKDVAPDTGRRWKSHIYDGDEVRVEMTVFNAMQQA